MGLANTRSRSEAPTEYSAPSCVYRIAGQFGPAHRKYPCLS